MTAVVDGHRSDFNLSFELGSRFPQDADILWRDAAGNNVLWLMDNTAADRRATQAPLRSTPSPPCPTSIPRGT